MPPSGHCNGNKPGKKLFGAHAPTGLGQHGGGKLHCSRGSGEGKQESIMGTFCAANCGNHGWRTKREANCLYKEVVCGNESSLGRFEGPVAVKR